RDPEVSGAIYLVPAGLELGAGEKELFDLLSRGRLERLESDDPETWSRRAGHARLFRALGEENEIREIFRRLLAEGVPVDDAEILYVDRNAYAPLVYELSREHDIPCTFADGIAVTYTQPGQAALGFLRWIARDYETEALHGIVAAGSVDLTPVAAGGEPPGSVRAARVLPPAGDRWGPERPPPRPDPYVAGTGWGATPRPPTGRAPVSFTSPTTAAADTAVAAIRSSSDSTPPVIPAPGCRTPSCSTPNAERSTGGSTRAVSLFAAPARKRTRSLFAHAWRGSAARSPS